MKTLKIFENAKVVSVNNGEIMIEVNSEIKTYHNAALVSVNNGIVKIEISKPLTEDILTNGRIVEYRNGRRRLVLEKPDGSVILVGEDGWASDPMSLSDGYEIVKVYEAIFSHKFAGMLKYADKLVWEK